MDKAKRKRLEAKGWTVGSPNEFLGLSDADELLIELRLSLSRTFEARRRELRYTQVRVAKLLGSSQSRVAKIELADPEKISWPRRETHRRLHPTKSVALCEPNRRLEVVTELAIGCMNTPEVVRVVDAAPCGDRAQVGPRRAVPEVRCQVSDGGNRVTSVI